MRKSIYSYVNRGVDFDGWYKFWLERDDGKIVKVSKARARELRRSGRLAGFDNGSPVDCEITGNRRVDR